MKATRGGQLAIRTLLSEKLERVTFNKQGRADLLYPIVQSHAAVLAKTQRASETVSAPPAPSQSALHPQIGRVRPDCQWSALFAGSGLA